MNTNLRRWSRLLGRFRLWARRVGLSRKLAYSLAAAAVASGSATVATMTGSSLLGPDPKTVLLLLYFDAVLLLLLAVVVARRLANVWAERRRGLAGSRLHVRLVFLFSVVAVTPAILVAVFSALFLNFGIQAWFNERVRTAVEESQAVARAYLHEHQQNIRADALAMANDLNRDAPFLMRNPVRFSQILSAQAGLRSLPEAMVMDGDGRTLARSRFSMSLELERVLGRDLKQAATGEVVVLTGGQEDRVRALVKLNRFADAYLLVGRFIESRVLEHIELTDKAVTQYKSLEKRRKGIQITFVMIFVVVALLLLLAAVWIGLTLATQLARPISNLISVAERVGKGDLTARVEATAASHEIGILSRAFNRMTSQIDTQQRGLVEANRQLGERSHFTETVLAGVSAGVIGLDDQGRIHLPNRSASELLATDLADAIGTGLDTVVPEMAKLLDIVRNRPDRPHQAEINVVRQDRPISLIVSITAESLNGQVIGYVVTFDDITELLSAQRTAAWADVARRIAHEIKNPLTPIRLSAERLKRKYLKQIEDDPKTFSNCIETIVRQVEDIGRMVDEFSSFARMPQATLKPENLSEICRQAAFLERARHPSTNYDLDLGEEDIHISCDRRQINQALTNMFKNAAESIEAQAAQHDPGLSGTILLRLSRGPAEVGSHVIVAMEDNGLGLPEEHRERLTEPYVTTRDKGTGLGLAIVRKIMEDHHGEVTLENRDGGGALISLVFHPESWSNDAETDDARPPDPVEVTTRILIDGS